MLIFLIFNASYEEQVWVGAFQPDKFIEQMIKLKREGWKVYAEQEIKTSDYIDQCRYILLRGNQRLLVGIIAENFISKARIERAQDVC